MFADHTQPTRDRQAQSTVLNKYARECVTNSLHTKSDDCIHSLSCIAKPLGGTVLESAKSVVGIRDDHDYRINVRHRYTAMLVHLQHRACLYL